MSTPVGPKVSYVAGDEGRSILVATWKLTTAEPVGAALELPEWADRTWSAYADAGGGAVLTVQGSNTDADAHFSTLSDVAGGTPLTMSSPPDCAMQLENPRFTRPILSTPGTAADWTVTLVGRRPQGLRS